jgi:hypothetical protein
MAMAQGVDLAQEHGSRFCVICPLAALRRPRLGKYFDPWKRVGVTYSIHPLRRL